MAAPMLPERIPTRPLRSSEITPAAEAKAVFRKPEEDAAADRRAHGAVIEHAMKVAGITPKDVSRVLNLDENNVYQWWSGAANAPVGRLCGRFPRFAFAYLQTMAAQSEHLEVSFTIRERRSA